LLLVLALHIQVVTNSAVSEVTANWHQLIAPPKRIRRKKIGPSVQLADMPLPLSAALGLHQQIYRPIK